eukprot:3019500-Rhodomonas_salina.1
MKAWHETLKPPQLAIGKPILTRVAVADPGSTRGTRGRYPGTNIATAENLNFSCQKRRISRVTTLVLVLPRVPGYPGVPGTRNSNRQFDGGIAYDFLSSTPGTR